MRNSIHAINGKSFVHINIVRKILINVIDGDYLKPNPKIEY